MVSQDWVEARQERLDVLHERLVTAVDALVSGDDWVRVMQFAAQVTIDTEGLARDLQLGGGIACLPPKEEACTCFVCDDTDNGGTRKER